MRINKIALAVATAALAFAGMASAASGTVTADNGFAVYTGNAAGSNLQLVGSGADWTTPFSFNFNVSAGDYLYVAATNWGGPRGLIGTFTTPVGVINTNTTDWLGSNTLNGVDYAISPLTSAAVQGSTWSSAYASHQYPWGTNVGNASAQWIWAGSSDTILLRTAATVAAVPEPETYAMLMAGLGLMGFVARRRQQKNSA